MASIGACTRRRFPINQDRSAHLPATGNTNQPLAATLCKGSADGLTGTVARVLRGLFRPAMPGMMRLVLTA
jgi:hypothetical protein